MTTFVWKPINTAPPDGQRIIVLAAASSGDTFITIGALKGATWALELDPARYRGELLTPTVWTEIPLLVL